LGIGRARVKGLDRCGAWVIAATSGRRPGLAERRADGGRFVHKFTKDNPAARSVWGTTTLFARLGVPLSGSARLGSL
jgi:hypothetical protein